MYGALCIIILLTGIISNSQQPSKSEVQRPATQSDVVSKYIQAAQHRDYKTLIDLTYVYQADVAGIKAQNPQVLWPKLIGEYYENKTKNLSQDPGFWGNFLQGAMADMGDPTQSLRALPELVPVSSEWSVSESRQQRGVPEGYLREFNMMVVYVTVAYSGWSDAPVLNNKILKQGILEFVIDRDSQNVLAVGRMPAGDVFWEEPLKVLNMAYGVGFQGPYFVFNVAGGKPPFTCSVNNGPKQDCYQSNSTVFWVNSTWPAIRNQTQATIQVSDSTGRTDRVLMNLPTFPQGLAPVWRYCWVRDPWFDRGTARPPDATTCKQPIFRLNDITGSSAAGFQVSETQPRSAQLSSGESKPPLQAQSPPEPQPAEFHVRHRHITFLNFQTSQAQSSCSGVLSISPDGTIKYDCDQTQDPSGRCDHFSFAPGSLTQVKIGLNGSLHFASKTQGKLDFFGDWNSIKQAYALITAGAHQTSTSSVLTASTSPPAPGQPINTAGICSNSTDLGYSLLAAGHLYRVKGVSVSGKNNVHVFYDEKGAFVSDPELLKNLAAGAWTRENIVLSPDARNGTRRVSAILETSQALQHYEMIQNALAMAMAEAVEAAVTGGASLEKAVPNIASNFVQSQFASPATARIVLTLAAQAGLQTSLSSYKQLETILPPADATALDLTTLLNVRTLYSKALGLELPEGALASALMPNSGAALTNQYLQSFLKELVPALPGPADAVTLKSLLDLQKSIATLGQSNTALRAYYDNFNLAINLSQANARKIEAWANDARSTCSATAQSAARGAVGNAR